jgi:hypothetical protein
LQETTIPWDKYLNLGARPHIKFFSDLFKDRPWWNLTPDWQRKFLVSTTLIGGSQIENDNYTLAAYDSLNAILGVVYCTEMQTITVDLSKITGPVKVQWYDPTSGEYLRVKGSPFVDRGLRAFTTPDLPHKEFNTDGSEETSHDWVLVVEGKTL